MKPRITIRPAAGLTAVLAAGILSILSAPLTLTGQNLLVSNSAVTASGTHYENNGTTAAALTVSGSLGSFTGTSITLTATAASAPGDQGAYVYGGGLLTLDGGAISTTGFGVYIYNKSRGDLTNINIKTTADMGFGIYALSGASVVNVTGGSIATGGANGVGIYYNSTAAGAVNNTSIVTEGAGAYGVQGLSAFIFKRAATVAPVCMPPLPAP